LEVLEVKSVNVPSGKLQISKYELHLQAFIATETETICNKNYDMKISCEAFVKVNV
jgi:hypothetical protein